MPVAAWWLLLFVVSVQPGCRESPGDEAPIDAEPDQPTPVAKTTSQTDLELLYEACRDEAAELETCQRYLFHAMHVNDGTLAKLEALAEEQPARWMPRYLIGQYHHRRGAFAESEAGYLDAAETARRAGDGYGQASSLYALATLLLRKGETDRAESLFEEVLGQARQVEDRALTSRTLYQISRRHKAQGRYSEERVVLAELESLADPGTNDQFLRTSRYAVGENLRKLGRHSDAAARFQSVYELAREAEDRSLEASASMALGVVALDSRQEHALELFRLGGEAAREGGKKKLEIHAKILAGAALLRADRTDEALAELTGLLEPAAAYPRLEARALLYLADAERLSGLLDAAEHRYLQAQELAVQAELPEENRDAFMGLAALYRSRGETEKAIHGARRAEALLEAMRDDIFTLSERTHFLHARADTYRVLAASLADLSPADLGQSFAALERAHSRTLRESLAARRGGVAAGGAPDLAGVMQRLDPGDLLIEYLLGEEESSLLVVTDSGASFHALPPRRVIDARVEAYLEVLLRPLRSLDARIAPETDFRRFGQVGHELFLDLLAPVAEQLSRVERLIVIPDRRLHLLPFEALLRQPLESDRPPAFLGATHAVEYLPAAALLAQQAGFSPRRVVVVEASSGRREMALSPLNHAAAEARAVAQAYPGGTATLLSGEDATLGAVEHELQRPSDVLHVTAHAILDPARGPRILLEESATDGDDWLEADRISSLDAAPDLVVLSACDTAGGELVGGEGILGLVRAFTLAGSSRIVASLWKVDDMRAVSLMRDFHSALAQGRSPSIALSSARAAALAEGFEHPFYWAGFVIYGAD